MNDPKDPPPEPQSRGPYQYVDSDRRIGHVAREKPADIGNLGRVAVITAVIGSVALVGFLMIMVAPWHHGTHTTMDKKHFGDLMSAFQLMAHESKNAEKLQQPGVRHHAGREFFEWALTHELLNRDLLGRIVSVRTETDQSADPARFFRNGSAMLFETECSYTSPKAGELIDLLAKSGDERTVLITFNSRNWNNYPDEGVLVAWSEGNVVEFMTFEEASDNWGITQAEWDDPAGKLFGKKAPFQHTYE